MFLTNFDDFYVWHQNLHHCVKLFFGNFLPLSAHWLFDIWHLLTIWHLLDILTHYLLLKPPQPITGLFFVPDAHFSPCRVWCFSHPCTCLVWSCWPWWTQLIMITRYCMMYADASRKLEYSLTNQSDGLWPLTPLWTIEGLYSMKIYGHLQFEFRTISMHKSIKINSSVCSFCFGHILLLSELWPI